MKEKKCPFRCAPCLGRECEFFIAIKEGYVEDENGFQYPTWRSLCMIKESLKKYLNIEE